MTPRDRLPAQDARGLSLEFRQMRREHKPCLDGGAAQAVESTHEAHFFGQWAVSLPLLHDQRRPPQLLEGVRLVLLDVLGVLCRCLDHRNRLREPRPIPDEGCNQHALSMYSAGTQHAIAFASRDRYLMREAISMHSACNQLWVVLK